MHSVVFEYILIALFWAIQLGITVVAAFVLGTVIRGVEQLIRKKKVKLLPRALVMLVLIVAILAALTVNPPVVCPEQYKEQFTQEQHHAVQSVSRGLYSANIPLVPIWAEVTEIEEWQVDGQETYGVEFTIHYLWFGTVGIWYSSNDGYSVEKPLTGW